MDKGRVVGHLHARVRLKRTIRQPQVQPKEDDHRFENQGVAVVVDKTSMQFVFGSEVDWVDGLQGAGFSVNNPNVVAACGCGSSFQVKEDTAEKAAASV